jgi:hypothetical protein
MARNSILRKLRQELDQDVTTERQVVYILAEIRKVVEQACDFDSYRALDFYCSFALHTRMDRAGAKRILERFDRAYSLWIRNEKVPRDLQNEIDQTAKLSRFREEMEAFVAANDLPTRLFVEPDAWVRFIRLYGNIIDECELVLRGDGAELQLVDRVIVHLEMAADALQTTFGNEVFFRICWTCHGKDGTSADYLAIFGYDAPS